MPNSKSTAEGWGYGSVVEHLSSVCVCVCAILLRAILTVVVRRPETEPGVLGSSPTPWQLDLRVHSSPGGCIYL